MSELLEMQQSYYEYVVRVEVGCQQIADFLRAGQQADALQQIIGFSEGVSWLVTVEKHMQDNFFKINSRLTEAAEMLSEINNALEIGDFVTVADLFEYEITPMFASASEWAFSEIKN